MKLHIFNPEHDLALAANLRQFTAPHAGRQLRSDLAYIPALWADKGDLVLVDDIDNALDKVRHLGERISDRVEFITKPQLEHMLKSEFIDSVHPWGWDLSLKEELKRIGMPEIMCPTDSTINKVREISSRQWAAEHLQQGVVYAKSYEQVKERVMLLGKAVVKAPWSSSGRGVRYVSTVDFRTDVDYPAFQRWASNIIFHQGGVTVEPYYNKVRDFGMEFEMRDGKAVYKGLSLFDTVKNAYTGNMLCTEEDKVKMLEKYVSKDTLSSVQQKLMTKIEPSLKDVYSGPFGVDLMICTKSETDQWGGTLPANGDFALVPCVELNLRRTMGHVALDLAKIANEGSLMRVDCDGNRYHLRVLPGRASEQGELL